MSIVQICTACGRKVGAGIPASALAEETLRKVPYLQKPSAKRPATKRARGYQEFMKSEAWRTLRRECRARDHGLCRMCGVDCFDDGEAHHRTYARFGGQEQLSDLLWLCKPCHRQETERAVFGRR